MSAFLTAVEAAKLGADLVEDPSRFAKWRRKLITRIQDGNVRILVFGPGGTGKTTLGRRLSGDFDVADHSDYEESISVERYSPEDRYGTVLVAPGQEKWQAKNWEQLFDVLKKGKANGVIHVVASGYHSFQEEQSLQKVDVYQDGMTDQQFLQAYIEDRRQREIDSLKELKTRVKDAPGHLWLLTLITKQDLWWKQKEDVIGWYEDPDGPYQAVLREIKKFRGQNRFTHTLWSAALLLRNFEGPDGAILKTTTGGYDDRRKRAHIDRMHRIIHDLCKA